MDCCTIVANQFDAKKVASRLAERHSDGPAITTRRIVDALSAYPCEGLSLLDIGAGFGDVQCALFARGLASATHVEISEPYSRAAHDIAVAHGFADRIAREIGDFVELAEGIDRADWVVLDRVVCCYDDAGTLIERSVPKARRLYVVSLPRTHWVARVWFGLENLRRRRQGSPFRMRLHSARELAGRIGSHGLRLARTRRTPLWKVLVFERGAYPDVDGPIPRLPASHPGAGPRARSG